VYVDRIFVDVDQSHDGVVVHHSEQLYFALEVVQSANLGLADRLDCKSLAGDEMHAFSNPALVAGADYFGTDVVILKDVGILTSDEEFIKLMAGGIDGLDGT
jgi:hypothetical protein